MNILSFLMTIACMSYDDHAGFAREFEMHFSAARRGSVRSIRGRLARRGIPIIQREIYRRHHVWIPKRKLKVRFERETSAKRVQPDITIETRSMRFRGKHWTATALPSKVVSYSKRRRRVAKKKRA